MAFNLEKHDRVAEYVYIWLSEGLERIKQEWQMIHVRPLHSCLDWFMYTSHSKTELTGVQLVVRAEDSKASSIA